MTARLLVAFGATLCVASAVTGWAWSGGIEGTYFNRSVGEPAYAGVFALGAEPLDTWSPSWFVLAVGRWVVGALGLAVAIALLAGARGRPRMLLTAAAACLVLSVAGAVWAVFGDLATLPGVWLAVAGAVLMTAGAVGLRVPRERGAAGG